MKTATAKRPKAAPPAASRFVDNGDGTVTDLRGGLMWSKDDAIAKAVPHKDAAAACKKLTLAGYSDWRLPTVEELFLLADRTRKQPAIDVEAFPTCKSDWYWTSTNTAWSSGCAWVVSFNGGGAYYDPRGYSACVRAVRSVPAGQ